MFHHIKKLYLDDVITKDLGVSFYAGTPIESPRFFKRDIALRAGGFDEEIVFYEEATLPIRIKKLGYNVRVRINPYILHYEEDFSLTKWLRKKYYYGKTVKKYMNRYARYADRQVSPAYRFSLILKS